MRRNNIQKSTRTQTTQNRKQNVKKIKTNKQTNIERLIKKHITINYNIIKSKRHRAHINKTTVRHTYCTVTNIQNI